MAANKLMLGAVLLLGFCLVGDALVPGFQPLHGGDDKKVGAWWWLSGSSGPRKLLKPAGGVGVHFTMTMEEQHHVAATDGRQLAEAQDAVGYKPISRCALNRRCTLPPGPPCKPYSRCRRIPPQP